jgi:ribosomal protein S10
VRAVQAQAAASDIKLRIKAYEVPVLEECWIQGCQAHGFTLYPAPGAPAPRRGRIFCVLRTARKQQLQEHFETRTLAPDTREGRHPRGCGRAS